MTENRLHTEYLPASDEAVQDIVLLHGWASNMEIWRPLLAKIRSWTNVTLIDLPGCSTSQPNFPASDLSSLNDEILSAAPEQAVYIGWSLGGQVAARLAALHPERVTALVSICSNPCFVAQSDWPGLDPVVFNAFSDALAVDADSCLRRFDSLQTSGSTQQRAMARALAPLRVNIDKDNLVEGLQLLEVLDVRQDLAVLRQPQFHLLGARDGLVSEEVPEALAALLASSPLAHIEVLENTSHVAPLEAADEIAMASRAFLQRAGLLYECESARKLDKPSASPEVDELLAGGTTAAKSDVAESFSRAASHYDSAAQLQREVGTRLLDSTDSMEYEPERVVDLGCGTGYFHPFLKSRFPNAEYLGIDLAPGMVEFARAQFPTADQWLVGDAENLPLASHSVDLIFSSLAIQWCPNLSGLFAELARVLKPGGRCVFTSLGPDTLKELRSSWAAVDGHQHVNSFLPALAVEQVVNTTPGLSIRLHSEQFQMEYDRVRELLAELKTLGAHNMNQGRQPGLTGRRALQGMLSAYESWRDTAGKLPATYDVLFGVVEAA